MAPLCHSHTQTSEATNTISVHLGPPELIEHGDLRIREMVLDVPTSGIEDATIVACSRRLDQSLTVHALFGVEVKLQRDFDKSVQLGASHIAEASDIFARSSL